MNTVFLSEKQEWKRTITSSPRADAGSFRFIEGTYQLEVFARVLGDRKQIRLFAQTPDISREIAAELAVPNSGLYFDWGPDSSRYIPYVGQRLLSPEPEDFLKLLHGLVAETGEGKAG